VDRFAEQYATLYEENRRNLEMLQSAGFAMPRELTAAAEFTLGRRFNEIIRDQQGSPAPENYSEALAIAQEAARRGLRIDLNEAHKRFTEILHRTVLKAVTDPTAGNLQAALGMLDITQRMGLQPDLNRPQELVYEAAETSPEFDKLVPLAERLGICASLLRERRNTTTQRITP
jgi:hypothetical protein